MINFSQTSSGNRSRPKRGNGTNTPDNELDKDKKHRKSPALHGSPSDKKQKQNNNNKETPTKNRKRNQNESDDKEEKETPSKKKKSEEIDVTDEASDNFEEKNSPLEVKLTKYDKIEEKEEKFQVKQEEEMNVDKTVAVGINNDKLNPEVVIHLKQEGGGKETKKLELEKDPLKLNPLSVAPVSVLVANTSDKNSDSKVTRDEENEEKLKVTSENEAEGEKVMTIDPKTGLIGPEVKVEAELSSKSGNISNAMSPRQADMKPQNSGQVIKNIPTKVIVREEKTDAMESKESEDARNPSGRTSKEINLIIPRPSFGAGSEGQSGSRMPLIQPKSEPKPSESKTCLAGSSSSQAPSSTAQLNLSKPKAFLISQNDIKVEPREEKEQETNKNADNLEEKNEDKKESNYSIPNVQEQSEKTEQDDSSSSAQITIIKPNPNLEIKNVEKKFSVDETQEKDSKPPVLTPSVSLPVNRENKDNLPPGLVPMGGIPPHLLGPHVPLAAHHYNYSFANPNRYTDKPTISIPNYNHNSNEQPQNLKIKQEVIQNPENFDPIQNLKDLKVPGQSSSSESPRNSFLPGPAIENIKKEPENYQGKEVKMLSPQMGVNQDGTLQNNPNLRVEREKDNRDYPGLGLGVVKLQEREERDVKPAPLEEESHTPPLPPTSRSNVSTPPVSNAAG